MAKKVKAQIRLHIAAGGATPAPPIGPALAQHGVNIMDFCQKFNAATKDKQGFKIPIDITIYDDRTYAFQMHQPPASQLLKKMAGIEKGAGEPNKTTVATITKAQLREVAKQKMTDLNTEDVEQAAKIIEGTARNMGIKIQ